MQDIFNPQDNQEIINRIEKLTPESTPKWGKMTVDQMLSHCQGPIDVAFGDLKLKANLLLQLVGKVYKKKLLAAPVFSKDSPTAPDFIRRDAYDFTATREELIRKVKRFTEEGTAVIKNPKHPFFGAMTPEEWSILQWKHLDHHLRQFGV